MTRWNQTAPDEYRLTYRLREADGPDARSIFFWQKHALYCGDSFIGYAHDPAEADQIVARHAAEAAGVKRQSFWLPVVCVAAGLVGGYLIAGWL